MSRVYTPITNEMADYIRSVSLREPEALRRQREETDNHPAGVDADFAGAGTVPAPDGSSRGGAPRSRDRRVYGL